MDADVLECRVFGEPLLWPKMRLRERLAPFFPELPPRSWPKMKSTSGAFGDRGDSVQAGPFRPPLDRPRWLTSWAGFLTEEADSLSSWASRDYLRDCRDVGRALCAASFGRNSTVSVLLGFKSCSQEAEKVKVNYCSPQNSVLGAPISGAQTHTR